MTRRILSKVVHEEAWMEEDSSWYGERGQIIETITIERAFVPVSDMTQAEGIIE